MLNTNMVYMHSAEAFGRSLLSSGKQRSMNFQAELGNSCDSCHFEHSEKSTNDLLKSTLKVLFCYLNYC